MWFLISKDRLCFLDLVKIVSVYKGVQWSTTKWYLDSSMIMNHILVKATFLIQWKVCLLCDTHTNREFPVSRGNADCNFSVVTSVCRAFTVPEVTKVTRVIEGEPSITKVTRVIESPTTVRKVTRVVSCKHFCPHWTMLCISCRFLFWEVKKILLSAAPLNAESSGTTSINLEG